MFCSQKLDKLFFSSYFFKFHSCVAAFSIKYIIMFRKLHFQLWETTLKPFALAPPRSEPNMENSSSYLIITENFCVLEYYLFNFWVHPFIERQSWGVMAYTNRIHPTSKTHTLCVSSESLSSFSFEISKNGRHFSQFYNQKIFQKQLQSVIKREYSPL